MTKKLITNYKFNATAQTVTLNDYKPIILSNLFLITNTTAGTIIYNFADSTKSATVSGNVLTLAYNTTGMANTDALQIIYDDGTTELTPYAVDPTGNLGVDTESEPVIIAGHLGTAIQQEETGELLTIDNNLRQVFGSQPLLSPDGRIKIQSLPPDAVTFQNIYTANSYAQLVFSNMATVVIQLYGTWVGTITFEATANNADWVAFYGYNLSTITNPVSTTTTAGIYKFDVVGIKGIRARFTAYTSGICQTMIIASAYADPLAPGTVAIAGTVPTTDTNVGLETVPIAKPGIIAPTQDSLVTAGAYPWAYLTPQIWARLRTEAGGSQRLPFQQVPFVNDMSVQDVPLYRLIEKLYVQTTLLGQAQMDAAGISYPNGWDVIT